MTVSQTFSYFIRNISIFMFYYLFLPHFAQSVKDGTRDISPDGGGWHHYFAYSPKLDRSPVLHLSSPAGTSENAAVSENLSEDWKPDSGYSEPRSATLDMFAGAAVISGSRKIASALRRIVNTEIGVATMQSLYDSVPFTMHDPDESAVLHSLVVSSKEKVDMVIQTLNQSLNRPEGGHSHSYGERLQNCYYQHANYGLPNRIFGHSAARGVPCSLKWSVNGGLEDGDEERLLKTVNDLVENSKSLAGIKSQYTSILRIATDKKGMAAQMIEYPGQLFRNPLRHFSRRWFPVRTLSLSSNTDRSYLVVIDFTGAWPVEFTGLKNSAYALLNALDMDDDVLVMIKTSTTCQIRPLNGCRNNTAMFLDEQRRGVTDYLEKLVFRWDHANATDFCWNSTFLSHLGKPPVVVYLAAQKWVMPNSLPKLIDTLTSILPSQEVQLKVHMGIVYDESAFPVDSQPRYEIRGDVNSPHQITTSYLNANDVSLSLFVDLFLSDPFSMSPEVVSVSDVVQDVISSTSTNDPIVSITVQKNEILTTALTVTAGADVSIGWIFEECLYRQLAQSPENSYCFVMNLHGYAIVHPGLERKMDVVPLVEHLETVAGFSSIKEVMLRTAQGNLTTPSGRRYAWKRIPQTPFIMCVVSSSTRSRIQRIRFDPSLHVEKLLPNLTYHRADLASSNQPLCFHENQLASTDTCGLFLAANAFHSPYQHATNPESAESIERCMAYLMDRTNQLLCERIKPSSIKAEVNVLRGMCGEWMNIFHSSLLNGNITRRFAATVNGVLVSFPAVLLDAGYNPVEQEWFREAVRSPGRIVLSPPVLRQSGPPLVTLSRSVHEAKHAAMHIPSDPVAVVIGAELTAQYLYSIILETVSGCRRPGVRCFLLDSSGYVVAHPRIDTVAFDKGPLERFHIAHVEPLVASELFGGATPVLRKKLCRDGSRKSWERYYEGNVSYYGAHVSIKPCRTFVASLIPATNMFLVFVNGNCTVHERAFCPCSVVDRSCLNCRRMEANDCECPCRCEMPQEEMCSGSKSDLNHANILCPKRVDDVKLRSLDELLTLAVPRCSQMACISRKSKTSCLKDTLCDWCPYEKRNGNAGWFCSFRGRCASGPGELAAEENDDEPPDRNLKPLVLEKSSAIVPLTCGILGCFCCVFIITVCCRHYHRADLDVSIMGENNLDNLKVTYLDNDEECPNAALLDNMGTPHGNTIPPGEIDIVSPYHINPGYRPPGNRRPPDSTDLGYSTATNSQEDTQSQMLTAAPSENGDSVVEWNDRCPGQRYGEYSGCMTQSTVVTLDYPGCEDGPACKVIAVADIHSY